MPANPKKGPVFGHFPHSGGISFGSRPHLKTQRDGSPALTLVRHVDCLHLTSKLDHLVPLAENKSCFVVCLAVTFLPGRTVDCLLFSYVVVISFHMKLNV